ncbi:peptidoglycan recognition protein 1-like [Macrosteles quadrilineatus]|uniref:peptidoglycan recognition protein 1-like n=1 Tax=Macrosteles quadrilineatus TaxID=74068 RepID=UPI0023E2AE3D|nr:peptidoglycan recognition protein 1-like [Macrosteles quadrilineatus]
MVLRKLELRDGVNIYVVTQQSWSVLPLVHQPGPALEHPISHIRFSYTGGPLCHFSSQCVRATQDIQRVHRMSGHADITYNFLIGGDGFVYQGRGWYHQCDLPADLSTLSLTCLDIAYIGDFSGDEPTYLMISTALELIRYGIKQGFIKPGFRIIPFQENSRIENLI